MMMMMMIMLLIVILINVENTCLMSKRLCRLLVVAVHLLVPVCKNVLPVVANVYVSTVVQHAVEKLIVVAHS
jgi:hypothetical protein